MSCPEDLVISIVVNTCKRKNKSLFTVAYIIIHTATDLLVKLPSKAVLNQAVPSPFLTSAQVGWIPIVSSSNSLVRPHLIAAAKPWVTSPALGPRTCSPITRFCRTGERKVRVSTRQSLTKALVCNSHYTKNATKAGQ